jgi:putative FmdB family regulatory protein
MPTYEYKCEKCGVVFEEIQSITAEPLKKCNKVECDGTVKRLFSAGAGFIFKGSGFYSTDYRSESYKKSAQSENSSPSTTPSTTPSTASTTP